MIWQSWGHSHGAAAKGEYSSGADALNTYEWQRFFAWFDRYLKGKDVDTGPRFTYYRDWVPFSGSGADTVQFGHAADFPVGAGHRFYLSGTDKLVRGLSRVQAGSASYSNVGGGVATSYSETSEFQGNQIPDEATPPSDLPGTFASWSSAALPGNLDVVGMPTGHVHVSAPTTDGSVPATQLLFFAKIYDVAPGGGVNLVHRLVAPARVRDTSSAVTVTLPGIVHRFRKGHRIEFVMAATDAAYKNAYPVQPVTVSTDPKSPSWVRLPVVGGTTAGGAGGTAGSAGTTPSGGSGSASGSTLPSTGGSVLTPALGAGALGLGLGLVALRRRRPARWR
jgi:LPXTG-motif cell wall-anchored protein